MPRIARKVNEARGLPVPGGRTARLLSLCLVTLAFLSFVLDAAASNWRYLERRGDERAARGRWSQARQYYLDAISAAGDKAPRSLWEKYNKAYQFVLREALARRAARRRSEGPGGGRAPSSRSAAAAEEPGGKGAAPAVGGRAGEAPAAPGDDTLGPEGSVASSAVSTGSTDTAEAYVEILPDGTVRMRLEDYLRGARITRLRMPSSGEGAASTVPSSSSAAASTGKSAPSRKPAASDEVPPELRPRSFWREPLADTSGGRTRFSPQEKVGLSRVLSAASAETLEESSIVSTPEYEVDELRFSFTSAKTLVVRGRVLNKTRRPLHNARVYVRLYNETGVFKARNWGYLKPGRQTLNPGRRKAFEVKFNGYTGTVGSFKIEVVADFKR